MIHRGTGGIGDLVDPSRERERLGQAVGPRA